MRGRASYKDSPAERARIAELVRQGGSIEEVVALTGRSDTHIRNICIAHGVPIPRQVRFRSTVPKSSALKVLAPLLNTTLPYAQIARELGVDRRRVAYIAQQARDAGIQIPDRQHTTA